MTHYRDRVFPLLSFALWGCFLVRDLLGLGDTTWLKFAAICLCCFTALTRTHTPDARLVAAALCLTVTADCFLLVSNTHISLGLVIFVTVQLLYALRLTKLRGKLSRPFLLARLLCAGGSLCLAVIEPTLSPLWAALLYFSCLLLNTAEAIILNKRRFAAGLLLFVCCDVCVGLWNLGPFLPHTLAELARIGMWLFYLPSQVLIVLSQE